MKPRRNRSYCVSMITSLAILTAFSACQSAPAELSGKRAIASLTELMETNAPRVSASIESGEFGAATSVELRCDDDTTCAAISYTLDGTEPDFAGNGVVADTVASGRVRAALMLGAVDDGLFVVRFRGRDLWGNVSGVTERRITVDKVLPRIRIAAPEISASDSTPVSFECTDGGSGCDQITYTFDGSKPSFDRSDAQILQGASGQRTIQVAGRHQIRAIARDRVGHTSEISVTALEIDRTAPATTVTPASGTYQGSVQITLGCADSGSGCAAVLVTTDGSTPMDGAPRTHKITSFPAQLQLATSATLRVVTRDRAGNLSAERSASYTIRGFELAHSR